MASGIAQGTLPWSWYSNPDLLRLEQERVLRHAWHNAGPAEHAAEPGKSEQLLAHFQTLVREALA